MSTKYIKLKDSPESEKLIFDYSSPFKFSSISSFKTENFKSAFSFTNNLNSYDNCVTSEEKESWSSQCLRFIISGLCYVLFVISFPLSLIICVKRVPSLERIAIIRLGKLQSIKGPGMVIILPCIDIWTRVNLKPQRLLLERTNILTADGGIIEITVEVEYQVADIINFVIRVQQLTEVFSQLSHHCLVNIASQKTQDDFENRTGSFESSYQEELNRTIVSWGLEIIKVQIQSIKVLKAAEPLDALSNLISSLRTAFGFVSEENPMSDYIKLTSRNSHSLSDVIMTLAKKAIDKGLFKNIKATFKFQVEDKVLYCFVNNESVELKEIDENIQSDVVISLSNNDLEDLLLQKISPVDAYQQGKINVFGDWKLLNKIF